ncbi:MAG TPA: acetylglutamate kinase [Chloroflexia bacterium]|jgi:acetylglutamate kinase
MMDETGADSYLGQHKGKRFVVKLGGEVMLNAAGLRALSADIATLARSGVGVVIVHGGGPQADALAAKLGHRVRKVAGRRVTDDDALEVAKMVYGGSINLELLAALRAAGAQGVGLSGVDATLITATRRMPVVVRDQHTGTDEMVDFGHVGDIAAVDVSLVDLLLGAGYVPVVASLAADDEGNLYNVNADTVAQALAVALHADRLYLLTNVPGILLDPTDPGSLLPICTREQAERLIRQGVISGGMLPKVLNCLQALADGVRQVQILDGTQERSLLLESLAPNAEVGTLLVE